MVFPAPRKTWPWTGLLYILSHLAIDCIILLDSPKSLPPLDVSHSGLGGVRTGCCPGKAPRCNAAPPHWMLSLHVGVCRENPGYIEYPHLWISPRQGKTRRVSTLLRPSFAEQAELTCYIQQTMPCMTMLTS